MSKDRLWCILFVALFMAMMVVSVLYAVNVPHLDDYLLVLDFLTTFEGTTGLWNKMQLIFDEANGHRIAFYHLFTVLDYSIFGETNFIRHVVFINLLYLGCVFIVWKIFATLKVEHKFFLPIALLLAVPCYAVLNWTSAGMVYCPSVLLALSTFYLLNGRSNSRFYGAIVCAAVATASSGAGLVIFMAATPFFIKTYDRRHLLIWSAAFVICLLLYFYGYDSSKPGQGLSVFHNPHITLANFIVYYGAYFQSLFGQHYLWTLISGAALLLITSWLFYAHRKEIENHPLLFSGILLALGYGLSATLMRSAFGLGVTAAFRYRLFQAILPVFLYMTYLTFSRNRQASFTWVVAISILIFGLRWEDNVSMMKDLNSRLSTGMYALQITNSAAFLPTKNADRTINTFEQAEQYGIYHMDQVEVVSKILSGPIRKSKLDPAEFIKSEEIENSDYYILQGWAFLKYRPAVDLDILIRLKSDNDVFYWPTGPLCDASSLILNSESGFTAVLDKHTTLIPMGTYQMDVILRHPIKGVVGEVKLDKEFVIN